MPVLGFYAIWASIPFGVLCCLSFMLSGLLCHWGSFETHLKSGPCKTWRAHWKSCLLFGHRCHLGASFEAHLWYWFGFLCHLRALKTHLQYQFWWETRFWAPAALCWGSGVILTFGFVLSICNLFCLCLCCFTLLLLCLCLKQKWEALWLYHLRVFCVICWLIGQLINQWHENGVLLE